MAMNQKYKQAWVDALRSGKFKQGKEFLCINDEYCCLGVLLEINKDTLSIVKMDDDSSAGVLYNGVPGLPTHDLQKEFFGKVEIPKVEINGGFKSLHDHNDQGKTFNEIADAIEEQL